MRYNKRAIQKNINRFKHKLRDNETAVTKWDKRNSIVLLEKKVNYKIIKKSSLIILTNSKEESKR